MNQRTTLLLIAASALALAPGCARRTRELPPEPVSSNLPGEGESADGEGAAGAAVPGSRAAFLQEVPADRVLFGFDAFSLDGEARRILDAQAAWLVANPRVQVTIEGHCDERGTREYNLALGDRRANSVRDYLEARGVAATRMQTISWGKERLEDPGSDEGAHARNRRSVSVVPV